MANCKHWNGAEFSGTWTGLCPLCITDELVTVRSALAAAEKERDDLRLRLEGIIAKEGALVGYPEMDVLRKVRNERDAALAAAAAAREGAIEEALVIADGIANGTNQWSEARRIAREIRSLSSTPGATKGNHPCE